MTIIKIKNSSIAGKQPSADQIEVAELALNLVDAALYTKDAAGNIIRLDSATSSGDTDSRPTNPTIGDLYYDTEIEALLYWDGTGWKEITDSGPINLGYTAAADKGTVTNTGGDDAELPLVDAANAGLMSPEDFDKLVDTGKITTDDGTPGTPNANDLWIDTSVCPPEIKIYSDCDNPGDFNWVSIGGGTPTPAITFTAAITDTGADGNQVGKILTAEAQNISGGNDPVESSYQWYVDGNPDSTFKTRMIKAGDVGLTITCDITVSERATNANPVTERATYAKTPSLAASISKPVVIAPPDGAGIGGDVTYTPKTSAITDVSGNTLTLTNSTTYNNADGSAMSAPISQTFLAGQTVTGVSATGTYGIDTPAFSTTTYTTTDTPGTSITTGINNTGKSLVWLKNRSNGGNHYLFDTERLGYALFSNLNNAQADESISFSFDANGFTLGNNGNINGPNQDNVAWNFRAAPGIFDIVTWTGDGTDKAYAHSLGTKPGCMIVKSTNETINWQVYHQDLGHGYPLILNSTAGVQDGPIYTVFSAEPTASKFSVGGGVMNFSGYEYVAYLFADTPGKIKCGSFVGGTPNQVIDCGFKAGWVMVKSTNREGSWYIFDTVRGMQHYLFANNNSADSNYEYMVENENGFGFNNITGAGPNDAGANNIYVAIAEDVVAGGLPPTGTLTADADDAGPTITLSGVTGTWEDGMEVVSNTEITEFGPGADVLQFVSTTPAGAYITTYGQATWEVDTDANFDSPMTATKTITPGSNQELLPSERGAITLADDTEYHVRVKYDSADPAGVESQYSDVNQFKTAAAQGGWNAVTAPEANDWRSVTYGAGKFVAISDVGTNRVMYSTDAINWTVTAASEDKAWKSVTYGDGKFVAVADTTPSAKAMYSSDGINWTSTAVEDSSWQSVTYGNGKFVAVADSMANRVMYSTNGINWTPTSAAESNKGWYSVTYGDGKFVAIAYNFGVMYSADGINWTAAVLPEDNFWQSVTYGDDKFVAVSNTGTNRVAYSTDGINWTSAAAPGANAWSSVTYGANKFVAVSYTGANRVMYSADGINWTLGAAAEDNAWYGVTYGDDKFVAVALDGTNQIMWSETGVSDPATFTAYDADNNKPVNDLNIVDRFGVDPTADNTHLGIYELTEQPTDAVAAYVPEGDKYKPIIDLSQPLEQAQAEAAQANARLDEANATIETMRSNFEERISALENPNTKTASTKTAKKN